MPTVDCFLNPPESSRSYSSVWDGESPGEPQARSMINSSQGWSSGTNQQGEWMQIDLGSVQNVIGVTTQTRSEGVHSDQRVTR